MHLSIIIVNYNVKYFLEQCLYSVQKACEGIDTEIIVIDNNSTDGSKFFLEPSFLKVNFIWNNVNAGFAKANNQGLALAKGKYILFLNPDTILPEDCIKKCLHFFNLNNKIGALGIRMVDGSGNFLKESKRGFPSPATSLFKLFGLASLFPRSKTFAHYYLAHLSNTQNNEVDVLAGAFIMIPKTVLNDIGNFDERFFMYGEDIDLSFRIQKAGYKNYYFADSTIVHFKGESTKKESHKYVFLFYSAMNLFVKKHYDARKAGFIIIILQIAILLRAALSAIKNLFKKHILPILDVCIILTTFLGTVFFWSNYIKREVNYFSNILCIVIYFFIAFFLLLTYYWWEYNKRDNPIQLIQSKVIAALVLLAIYFLLPQNISFLKGVLLFGILLPFVLMSIIKWLFNKVKYAETKNKTEEKQQTIIVAEEKEFIIILNLLQKTGLSKNVLGRIGNWNETSPPLGNIKQLPEIVKKYMVKEIIFCENGSSFKEIINTISILPQGVRNKFHTAGSNSIVGSDSKNLNGDYIIIV